MTDIAKALSVSERPSDATPAKNPPDGSAPGKPGWHQLHQFAESLSNAIDAKDHCTRLHSQQVATLAHALALQTGMSPAQAEAVHIAGHLHDIGKIGVPDSTLKKTGPLTPEEWELVRQHPKIGEQIVRPVKALNGASGIADMILHHHERWDGKGYPHGLSGRAIPPGARILAVADTFSAMVQDRPYRPGMSLTQAMAELGRVAGSQLDPDGVTACLKILSGDKAESTATGARLISCPLTRCPWQDGSVLDSPPADGLLFPFCSGSGRGLAGHHPLGIVPPPREPVLVCG